MSIAKEAGLPVPEFFLSKNQALFVMRRFDRTDQGEALGFEDMAVLTGRGADKKYDGSYAALAKVIRLFASPEHVQASLSELFDSVALSCMVGNGDAHLKNFGLLYGNPTTPDCRLAPAFDIVNTTAYIGVDLFSHGHHRSCVILATGTQPYKALRTLLAFWLQIALKFLLIRASPLAAAQKCSAA